jgi:hypothetical protein
MGRRKVDVEKIDSLIDGVLVSVVADPEILLLLVPLQGRIFQLFGNGVSVRPENVV